MPELITLAVDCVHCHRTVRLYVSGSSQEEGHPVVWTCPHCYEANNGRFPGQLEFIDAAEPDE